MKLIDNLFVAENVTDLETVVYSLRRSIPVLHLYCIVLFEDKNRLEILTSRDLFHERNKNRPAQIAGIAMEIAGKVVGRQLSDADQAKLVDQFSEELG